MNKGALFVISAPAGCGKDTILEQALKLDENLFYSVSATTRAKRPGEVEGVSYYFKQREEFEKMIRENMLLEYAEYCGNYYGTPKKAVSDMLEMGRDVILKIEIQGAANVKKIFPEAVMVFILPPSIEELGRRLRGRGTEDEETVLRRLETAKTELQFAKNYNYVIVNGELEKAVEDLLTIVRAQRFLTDRNSDIIHSIV